MSDAGESIAFTQLRELLSEVVSGAIGAERLARRNGMLVIGVAAPSVAAPERLPSPLAQIITGGEHELVEFKETLRWDVVLGEQNKKLEDVAVKTLAGFANRSGGTLLIGVADDGAVPGLARDFACLGGNRDKLELHLTNLLGKHFGPAFRAARIKVSFPQYEDVEVCRVDIEPSPMPVFVSTAHFHR